MLCFGCSNETETNAIKTNDGHHRDAKYSAIKHSFSLTPKIIFKGDILKINLPEEHPKKLSIKTPEGNWLIVHSAEENIFLVTEQAFKSAEYLEISTKTTKGLIWKNGQPETAIVFNQPGEYMVYLADNLETEPENTFHFMDTVIFK